MLTEKEMYALEHLRAGTQYGYRLDEHRHTLANAMLRLFPKGWSDPITFENLASYGWCMSENGWHGKFLYYGKLNAISRHDGRVFICMDDWEGNLNPKNMLDVFRLMEEYK